jgi:DNA polymerase elongation subunit (family B)
MGIVLKRRDNAQIVKIVCGGIVDQLLNKHDPRGAIQFTKETLRKILTNKYPIDKFIITKTLRENYANRTSIAHAVLADRMAERDPGNKPLSNDRIPYVFIVPNRKVTLQGERVETPDYVIQNNLQIDYLYYITNQIMKPAIQFLELVTENPEQIFNRIIMIEKNRLKGARPISSYY